MGPNGSGKTTILRTLSRLLSPIKGVVRINGQASKDFRQSELAKHGFSISTGVIHENDIDFHVARAVGAEVVAEKPFVAVGMENYIRAGNIMEKADHIVAGRKYRLNLLPPCQPT